ncbi:deoxyribodipyrimidine photo-lyase [Nakamurella silvestris]|nr:deoxyribodipyrimidine photo-lyase [Nakamurella silvestris]
MSGQNRPVSILWFRRDLRITDHPALLAAGAGVGGAAFNAATGKGSSRAPATDEHRVLGVFVLDPALLGRSGLPRREFLVDTLAALDVSMGGSLLILSGDPAEVLPRLARTTGAGQVHITTDFGVYGTERDRSVEKALAAADVDLVRTGSPYAVAPGRVRKPDGTGYAVFTPYYKGWLDHGWRPPATGTVDWVDPDELHIGHRIAVANLKSHTGTGSSSGADLPEAGETAALRVWKTFLDDDVVAYDEERDRPDHPGTSRMSAYLKWGSIHPRTMLAELAAKRSDGATSYARELAWREFYADLVFQRPESVRWSINPLIDRMEWDSGPAADEAFQAWQEGRTGYPYIDAAMRQLLAEGWIHNRARMAVASFLIKDLHLPWQRGARHFMDHLVDGDAASNSHGWQWAAGAGPQASPFFRIFHPVTQGVRHDPDGMYVRRYVPELAGIVGKAVHTPWELPGGPPAGYPLPIVDHAEERVEALRRWENRPRS